MNIDEAIKQIKAMDDGEWMFAFDSLGMYQLSDTLSNIQNGRDTDSWRVFALLDYMARCEAERP